MINSYEIRKQNSEEILYLYFDLNSEFSKINFKDKKEKLENIIKDFIRENKIIFTGTTVALIIGGTIVGNVILNNDTKPSTNNSIIYEEKVKTVDNGFILEEKALGEEVTEIKEDINNTEVENILNNQVENENNKDVSTKEQTQVQESTMPSIQGESKVDQETLKEEPQDNRIYVKVKRSNGTIISIELEEYLIGVVGAEMPAAFSNQALMAQAIIARTYALKANSKGQILTDNESTQSYKDDSELKSMWGGSYNTYYDKIKNAVESTEGMYLSYNGTYIEAVYHSTSNGSTEDATNVWGNYFPYLVSVESPYDNLNPSFLQSKTISYQELSLELNDDINIDTSFNIISKTSSGRVQTIEISGKIYTGIQIRSFFNLRSTDFDITKTYDGVIFTTRGYGHGVGMSQYGANGMAKNGYSYIQILKHYYQGVSISHL